MKRKGKTVLSVTLLRRQIKFLDSLIKKCRVNNGNTIFRSGILRSLIRIMEEFDMGGVKVKDEDEMVEFLLSRAVKRKQKR